MQHNWPHYEVAPDESIRALGFGSINYTRFGRTHARSRFGVVARNVERHLAIGCAEQAREKQSDSKCLSGAKLNPMNRL
jgi:hypothetical protein